MRPTSALCHTQAARQRNIADAAELDNVRAVALTAAAAWDNEAVLAEKREARADAGMLAHVSDGANDDVVARPSGPECD